MEADGGRRGLLVAATGGRKACIVFRSLAPLSGARTDYRKRISDVVDRSTRLACGGVWLEFAL